MRRRIGRILLLAAVFSVSTSVSGRPDSSRSSDVPEKSLAQVIQAIESGRADLALLHVDNLIAAQPNFRLAHLIRGDLLAARVQPLKTFGSVSKTVPREKVDGLRAEALARLRSIRHSAPKDKTPRYVLQLDEEQKYAFIVESGSSRLYVFENAAGRARYMSDYYVTLGKRGVEKSRKGDKKTPLGVYHVTAILPQSKLTDFYGAGAFPINYPNAWDKRHGRNGHGIWLHGTPADTYSRAPNASDGCIVLANPDLETIAQRMQIGLTPVIIADQIEWADSATIDAERKSLAAAIENWRTDWESRNTDNYLRHYSPRFLSGKRDYAAWAAHKRRVNTAKDWIKIGVRETSMFRYPRERDVVVVSFKQYYRSSNLSNEMRKIQYWRKESGSWRIMFEGKT